MFTGAAPIGKSGNFLLVCRRVIRHWRGIISLLILAPAAFLIADGDFWDLFLFTVLVIFIASQFFWIGWIVELGERFIPGKPRRAWLAVIAGLVYLVALIYSYPSIESTSAHVFRPADYRLRRVLIEAAYWWWFVGSQVSFLLLIAFWTADRTARATAWVYGKARAAIQGNGAALKPCARANDPASPDRRHFLEQTALLVSATGFVAAGYGLLYGRQNVQIVRQRIRLARLPGHSRVFGLFSFRTFTSVPSPQRITFVIA